MKKKDEAPARKPAAKESSKESSKEAAKGKKGVPPPTGARDMKPVLITLSKAYLQLLEAEAERYGGVSRSQLLVMLLRWQLGELDLNPPGARCRLTFTDEELSETEAYTWYVPTKHLADLERVRETTMAGRLSIWLMNVLNEWVARPRGLGVVPPAPPKS